MSEITEFRSRNGIVSCNAKDVYLFVTNIENFKQFIPGDTISEWSSDVDSCRFKVNGIGSVNIKLSEKEPYSKVVYTGEALQKNNFTIHLDISGKDEESSVAGLVLRAEMDPFMKMIITKPAERFLELLVSEMEKFSGWRQTNE